MFASRMVRNVGAMGGAGNRLMSDGNSNRTMLVGAGGLAVLTALVYWAGWKAEGARVGQSNRRDLQVRAQENEVQSAQKKF